MTKRSVPEISCASNTWEDQRWKRTHNKNFLINASRFHYKYIRVKSLQAVCNCSIFFSPILFDRDIIKPFQIVPLFVLLGCQVAQSVERRTLEVEVRGGSKPALCTWWRGRIQPNQPYPKGAAPAATTLLAEWWPKNKTKQKQKKKTQLKYV